MNVADAELANVLAESITALANRNTGAISMILNRLQVLLPLNVVMERELGRDTLAVQWTWQKSFFQTVLQDIPAGSPTWRALPPTPYPFEDDMPAVHVPSTQQSLEHQEESDEDPFDELLSEVDWDECIQQAYEI